MKHVLSILVQNQPGVLVRVAGLFSRRGFNIDSLAVGVTHSPEYSRMTVVVDGDEAMVTQVVKQVEKLVEVAAVQVLPSDRSTTRGLVLLKVHAAGEHRMEIMKLAEVFRAKVVDMHENVLTLELTGDDDKIDALVNVMKPFGLMEMVRTGLIGLERGDNTIYNWEENEYEQNAV